ncbi:hypothetical protein F9K97_23885 [Brucella anthropi]|nr:hypothetical protein F9K97_23885 [Brucella anthropi]
MPDDRYVRDVRAYEFGQQFIQGIAVVKRGECQFGLRGIGRVGLCCTLSAVAFAKRIDGPQILALNGFTLHRMGTSNIPNIPRRHWIESDCLRAPCHR